MRRRSHEAPSKLAHVELSPDDIQALRERVRRRSILLAGRGWPVVRLVGGPLDGLRFKLEPQAARGEFIGFCHPTDKALAQMMYRRKRAGLFVFDSIYWTKARAAPLV